MTQNEPLPVTPSPTAELVPPHHPSPMPIVAPPHPPQAYATPAFAQQNPVYLVHQPKSVLVAFILTFFFGALGMLYATVSGALIMLGVCALAFVLNVIIGLVSFGTLDIITVPLSCFGIWVVCMVWACLAASNHNTRLLQQAAEMRRAYTPR